MFAANTGFEAFSEGEVKTMHASRLLSVSLCPTFVSLEQLACFWRGEIKWNLNYSSLLLFTGVLSQRTGSNSRQERGLRASAVKGDT